MSFLANVKTMLGGFIIAQIIPLLATPFLARLYAPEAFGLQALFMSLAAALGVLGTLRLDLALLLADEQEEQELIGIVFVLLLIVLTGSALALVLFRDGVDAFWGVHGSTAWLWLLIPMTAASVFFLLSTAILTKMKRFFPLARANVANQAVYAVVASVLPAFAGTKGLVIAKLLGQLVGAGTVAPVTAQYIWQRIRIPGRRRLLHLWTRFPQFIIFNAPYSLVGAMTRDTPIYIFSALSASAAAGYYSLSRLLLSVPNLIATAALSQVFYREALDLRGTSAFEGMTMRLLQLTLLASAPLFAFLVVWGDVLFSFLFGNRWIDAGVFAMIMAPTAWLSLQTGWPERLFEVALRQDLSFKIQIAFDAAAAAVVVLLMLWGGNPVWAVAGFAMVNSLYHLTYLAAIFRVSGFSGTGLLGVLLAGIGLMMFSSLLLVLIRLAPVSSIILATLSVLVSVGIAFGIGILTLRNVMRFTASLESQK